MDLMHTGQAGTTGLPGDPVYDERLGASASVWATGMALTVGVVPVFIALVPPVAVVAISLTAFALVGLAIRSWSARVTVVGGELLAGRARIPVDLLGAPEVRDRAAAAHLRGPGIEPRAYHLIRPWVGEAVTVPVTDPADPTPYWYVATRHPEDLASAIRLAQRPPAA